MLVPSRLYLFSVLVVLLYASGTMRPVCFTDDISKQASLLVSVSISRTDMVDNLNIRHLQRFKCVDVSMTDGCNSVCWHWCCLVLIMASTSQHQSNAELLSIILCRHVFLATALKNWRHVVFNRHDSQ